MVRSPNWSTLVVYVIDILFILVGQEMKHSA